MKKSILFLAMLCTLLCVFTACHEHIFGDWKTVKEPTCTEEGTKERTCECGEKESEAIPAVGHTEGEWVTDKEATCTEKGEKHLECAVCGETIRSEEIPAAGHTEGEWVTDKEATCTKEGSKYLECAVCGEALKTETISVKAHNYAAATCTSPKKCVDCGATTGAELGHNYNEATCVSAKRCTRCGTTSGSALGHNYSAATCTSAKKCTRCGITSGSALGHNYADATCTSPKKCTRCGVTTGSALGHNYADATCTSPKKCTRCGVTTGSALGHKVVTDSAVAATCTKSGKTEGSHCSVCGKVIKAQTTIAATGKHTYNGTNTCPNCGTNFYSALCNLVKNKGTLKNGEYTYTPAHTSSMLFTITYNSSSNSVKLTLDCVDPSSGAYMIVNLYLYNAYGSYSYNFKMYMPMDTYEMKGTIKASGYTSSSLVPYSSCTGTLTTPSSSIKSSLNQLATQFVDGALDSLETILAAYTDISLEYLGFTYY